MDFKESSSCANQMPAFPIAVRFLPVGFAFNNEVESKGLEDKKVPEEMLQTEHVEQADGGGATPHNIRSGLQTNGYVYSEVTDVIYKCCRGSDNCPDGYKLWLLLSFSGHVHVPLWVAYAGPDEGSIPQIGQLIFTSSDAVLLGGWHAWRLEMCDGRKSSFLTTVL